MALTLNHTREPINHGDIAVWFNYMMQQARRGGEGGLSMELYNNAGALWLSQGFGGINDGVVRGSIECTIAGAISLVGLTVDTWAAVEAAVSGTAVTISITSIAAGTDESTIPAAVKAAYDYTKQGYYLVAGKRLVGIAYIKAAGTLGRIVNCESGKLGFKGIEFCEKTNGATKSIIYIAKRELTYSGWNMDTTQIINLNLSNYDLVFSDTLKLDVRIKSSTLPNYDINPLCHYANAKAGGMWYISKGTLQITLYRENAGTFDNASFNNASVFITATWET